MSTRRRMMMARRGGEDPYADWEFGCAPQYNKPNVLVANADYATSPYFPIPASGLRLTFMMCPSGAHGGIRSYLCKGDYTYRDGGSGSRWIVVTNASDAYARLVVWADEIDDCYLYDQTNGLYLWKGKNVT